MIQVKHNSNAFVPLPEVLETWKETTRNEMGGSEVKKSAPSRPAQRIVSRKTPRRYFGAETHDKAVRGYSALIKGDHGGGKVVRPPCPLSGRAALLPSPHGLYQLQLAHLLVTSPETCKDLSFCLESGTGEQALYPSQQPR